MGAALPSRIGTPNSLSTYESTAPLPQGHGQHKALEIVERLALSAVTCHAGVAQAPSAAPASSARPHNWRRLSDSRAGGPISRDSVPASGHNGCADDAAANRCVFSS